MYCEICKEPYTYGRDPMVINCGHSFCSYCIYKMNRCPFDKEPIKKINKNYQYINLLQNSNMYEYPYVYRHYIAQNTQ